MNTNVARYFLLAVGLIGLMKSPCLANNTSSGEPTKMCKYYAYVEISFWNAITQEEQDRAKGGGKLSDAALANLRNAHDMAMEYRWAYCQEIFSSAFGGL